MSSALLIPLAKSLLANQLPKATIELAFYTKQGRFVHRKQVGIDKTAREGWQLLHLDELASQDGYMMVRLQNRSKTPVYFDDVLFQTMPTRQFTKSKGDQTLTSINGFPAQVSQPEQGAYRLASGGCYGAIVGDGTAADGDYGGTPIDGGTLPMVTVTAGIWLNISVTVTAPAYSYYNAEIVIIGYTGGTNGGQTNTGGNSNGTGDWGGDGSSNSGSTLIPAGAPKNPPPGTPYTSKYTGKTYIYDGNNWFILLPEANVKGTPPHNPPSNTTYTFNTITYTFQYGSWTIPYPGINNAKVVEYVQDKCAGYKRMLDIQKLSGKEIVAFMATTGEVFILPYEGNSEFESTTLNTYYDSNGRVVFAIDPNPDGCGENLISEGWALLKSGFKRF